MYLPSYLPTYLPTYLPSFLLTYLTTYVPTYLSTYTYLPTYLGILEVSTLVVSYLVSPISYYLGSTRPVRVVAVSGTILLTLGTLSSTELLKMQLIRSFLY